MKSPQGSVPKWPKSSPVWPTLQWPQAVMADANEPHAPGPTSDSTSGGLHPLTAGLLARHDRRCAPTATALSKRPADWPAAEQERVAVRIRGAAPRMANLEPVEKTAVVSDSTGADAAPAIRARPTRSSSAQLALEPTALLNRRRRRCGTSPGPVGDSGPSSGCKTGISSSTQAQREQGTHVHMHNNNNP